MNDHKITKAQKNIDTEVSPAPIALHSKPEYGVLVTDPGILLLYQIIDDIDTLSDMIKPNNEEGYKAYYNAVLKQISRKEAIFESDGYSVFRKDKEGEKESCSTPTSTTVACRSYPQGLYLRARETWGDDRQWSKLAEELCECAAAILRWRDQDGATDSLTEEMADAEIMLEQCRIMIGSHKVEFQKKKKLARLEARLKEEEI